MTQASDKSLDGKVAIVTGSSRGIGKAIAKGFAAAGAKVVVSGRTSTGSVDGLTIDRTVQEIVNAGGQAIAIACDVSSESDINELVAKTLRTWGRIDILVNNAALKGGGGIMDTDTRRWADMMRTNIDGVFLCTRAVVPAMEQQGGGSVIIISSGAANSTNGDNVGYGVSKAAADRFTVKAAAELHARNIAVNAYNPGGTLVETSRPNMRAEGGKTAEEKNIIPGCLHLAQQRANGITGKILNDADYGTLWP